MKWRKHSYRMVAKLEAIKQNFLSCDELEENNYLKEESKAGFLQALVYALVFKNVKISCRFTLDYWKHPPPLHFFLSVLNLRSGWRAQVLVHSPTNQVFGRSWRWAMARVQIRYAGAATEGITWPCILMYLLMDDTVISHGGDLLLGLLWNLFQSKNCFFNLCSLESSPDRLSCFLLRSVGIFQLTSMESWTWPLTKYL